MYEKELSVKRNPAEDEEKVFKLVEEIKALLYNEFNPEKQNLFLRLLREQIIKERSEHADMLTKEVEMIRQSLESI